MFAPLLRQLNRLAPYPGLYAKCWSLWLPFLAAGIRVDHISRDFRQIDVSMRLKLRNTNYVGTHFGGSLYAMTDPFFMAMFIHNLGEDYIVWDQAASIHFKKPGVGTVRAHFRLSQTDIDQVLHETAASERGKTLWQKTVSVVSSTGEVVATVDKVVYIRKKAPKD
jgi:acyl-coenzyme A thioesterase PaaI-like protein